MLGAEFARAEMSRNRWNDEFWNDMIPVLPVQHIRNTSTIIEIVNKGKMPFPLAKLISLGLKQSSKHVASFVKQKTKEHETMKKIIIKSAECEYFPITCHKPVSVWYQCPSTCTLLDGTSL